MKLDSSLSSPPPTNSKWIKGLSVRSETLKLLEERVRSALQDSCSRRDFLRRTPITQEMGPAGIRRSFLKFVSLCRCKGTGYVTEEAAYVLGKGFASHAYI